LFRDFINLFSYASNLNPHDADLYFEQGGSIHDACIASMRGCGDSETISVGQIIGEYACNHNDMRFIDVLVKHQYNLSQTVIYSSIENSLETLQYCISIDNKYVNTRGHRGKTPLYYAILNASVKMVEYLIENGADPELTYSAAQLNYLDHAMWVFENKHSKQENEPITYGVPFYDPLPKKQLRIIEILIKCGTKVTKPWHTLTSGQQDLLLHYGYEPAHM
jgi:hypothetical protein